MYIPTYKEYKKNNTKTPRDFFRDIVLDGLALKHQIFNEPEKNFNKNRIQFLYIHHVFNDEKNKLTKLVESLSKNHTFISYSDAVNKILTRQIDKPYIVFSSDDGLKNNMNTLNVFNDFSIKACFFINPELIGETDYEKIKTHCKLKLNSPPSEFLNWHEIDQLLKAGHEVGSHTMDHINLTKTKKEEIKENIEKSYKIIKEHCGTAEHFAFPYGTFNDFNKQAAGIVYKTGFKSVASAVRGVHINHNTDLTYKNLCIRRDHIVLAWKLKHSLFFISKNAKFANTDMNLYSF